MRSPLSVCKISSFNPSCVFKKHGGQSGIIKIIIIIKSPVLVARLGNLAPALSLTNGEGFGTSLNLSRAPLLHLWHRDNIMSLSNLRIRELGEEWMTAIRRTWKWFEIMIPKSPRAETSYSTGNAAHPQEILTHQKKKHQVWFLK